LTCGGAEGGKAVCGLVGMLVVEDGVVVGIEFVRFRVERGIFELDDGLLRLMLALASNSKLKETTLVCGVMGFRGVDIRLRL